MFRKPYDAYIACSHLEDYVLEDYKNRCRQTKEKINVWVTALGNLEQIVATETFHDVTGISSLRIKLISFKINIIF